MKPYKGYQPRIWFEASDAAFHGVVEGITDTIHFQGTSVTELQNAFHNSVDDYLNWAAEDGFTPDKPFAGKVAFRTTPDTHRKIAMAAAAEAKSINQFMEDALEKAAEARLQDSAVQIALR